MFGSLVAGGAQLKKVRFEVFLVKKASLFNCAFIVNCFSRLLLFFPSWWTYLPGFDEIERCFEAEKRELSIRKQNRRFQGKLMKGTN